MGTLGAYFCGDFHEICDVIGYRLRALRRTDCLAVIVFANARTELFAKHLSPYIKEWHYRSAECVEFVFPGFQGTGDPKEHMLEENRDNPEYQDKRLDNHEYQDYLFVRATEEFQSRSAWRYSGEPAVIICNASISGMSPDELSPAVLQLHSCIEFDLAEALRTEVIRSVPTFFQGIISFAKENPACASAWKYSDRVGIRSAGERVKDGLIQSVSKWLGVEDLLPKTLQVAKCFAVRSLEAR
jgi:hypothetical protein